VPTPGLGFYYDKCAHPTTMEVGGGNSKLRTDLRVAICKVTKLSPLTYGRPFAK